MSMGRKVSKTLIIILVNVMLFWNVASAVSIGAKYRNITVSTQIETLDMGDTTVKDFDEFISFLEKLPNLKTVNMYTTKLKVKQMDELTQRFPDIDFGVTLTFADGHTIRNDATAFSTLHSAKSDPHRSDDFEVFKYCNDLQALDLGHNRISDLSFLSYCPHLKILIIACNSLTDITPLAQLKELEYLELFKNKVGDLSPLQNLTNLKDLNIAFNAVEDWTPLYQLTQLERLWMSHSSSYSESKGKAMTDEVVGTLAQALPNTYIDSTSYSTRGGWREHSRYDDITDIFKTRVYHPWTEAQ